MDSNGCVGGCNMARFAKSVPTFLTSDANLFPDERQREGDVR